MSLPILCEAISSVNVANLCFQTQLVFVFHDMFSTTEYSGLVSSSNGRYITLWHQIEEGITRRGLVFLQKIHKLGGGGC